MVHKSMVVPDNSLLGLGKTENYVTQRMNSVVYPEKNSLNMIASGRKYDYD